MKVGCFIYEGPSTHSCSISKVQSSQVQPHTHQQNSEARDWMLLLCGKEKKKRLHTDNKECCRKGHWQPNPPPSSQTTPIKQGQRAKDHQTPKILSAEDATERKIIWKEEENRQRYVFSERKDYFSSIKQKQDVIKKVLVLLMHSLKAGKSS